MIEAIRSLLSFPQAYQSFFDAVGGAGRNRTLVREYIRPKAADRVLDIGCGPGTMVPYLPESEYVGFDASAEYIDQARRRFPHARFVCEWVSRYALSERNYFDIVLALGVLHHLDDAEALTLSQIAHGALKPGGKLVTLDGVWTNGNPVWRNICWREIVGGTYAAEKPTWNSPLRCFRPSSPAFAMTCCEFPTVS